MIKTNYKNKIYILSLCYIVGCIILFGYGFGILDNDNASAEKIIKDQRTMLNDLQNEQRSFQLASQDLETLKAKAHQPDDFFSKDVRVVNEIKTLETIGAQYNVGFELKISGTAASGAKTPGVTGSILSIPYTIGLTGGFSDIMAFMEQMEQLGFVTHVKAVSLSNAGGGKVHAVLNAIFYIQK